VAVVRGELIPGKPAPPRAEHRAHTAVPRPDVSYSPSEARAIDNRRRGRFR
jgi:hypothetical protein